MLIFVSTRPKKTSNVPGRVAIARITQLLGSSTVATRVMFTATVVYNLLQHLRSRLVSMLERTTMIYACGDNIYSDILRDTRSTRMPVRGCSNIGTTRSVPPAVSAAAGANGQKSPVMVALAAWLLLTSAGHT